MKRQLIALAIGAAVLQSPAGITAQAPQTPPSVTFSVDI